MAWATVLTDVTFFFFFNAYIGGGGRWWWRWGAARVRWEEMARHRRSDRRGQHSKRHCCGAGRRSLGERRGQRGNIQIYTVLQILCVGSKWLWLIMKWFTAESPVIRSIFDGRIWLNILMPSLCELWVKWQSALCVTVLNVYFFSFNTQRVQNRTECDDLSFFWMRKWEEWKHWWDSLLSDWLFVWQRSCYTNKLSTLEGPSCVPQCSLRATQMLTYCIL